MQGGGGGVSINIIELLQERCLRRRLLLFYVRSAKRLEI
jgi:hypothetical protein